MSVIANFKGNVIDADGFVVHNSTNNGPSITTGTGAPTASANNGSIYLRTDGAAATTLYLRTAGAWTVVTSA